MPDGLTPEATPQPPPASNTIGCWFAILIVAAGGIGGLLLVAAVVNVCFHALTSRYNALAVPPGDVSDAQFWGVYALYAGLIALEISLLDKFDIVRTPAGWLVLVLIAITAIVAPLAILFTPQETPPAALELSVKCGSWLAPAGWSRWSSLCARPLDGESRNALTVMAIGFAIPLLLMSLRVWGDWSDARKKQNPPSPAA